MDDLIKKEPPYEWEREAQQLAEIIARELIEGAAVKIGQLKLRDGDVIEIEMRAANRKYKATKTIWLKGLN